MRKKGVTLAAALLLSAGILALTLVVLASDATSKPFREGQAGQISLVSHAQDSATRPVEGIPPDGSVESVGVSGQRDYEEGAAGSTGLLTGAAADIYMESQAPTVGTVVLKFSGVTDDGQKSSSARKEATSILCTNTGNNNASVEVQLFQWSGSMVYTATVSAPPKASYTFSTQNTTIYFDDVIFGTGGGTDAIFQGYGRVLSNRPGIICTAEALDPLNYPPIFVSGLEMYRP